MHIYMYIYTFLCIYLFCEVVFQVQAFGLQRSNPQLSTLSSKPQILKAVLDLGFTLGFRV